MLIVEGLWTAASIAGMSLLIARPERGPVAALRSFILCRLALAPIHRDTLDAIAHGLRCPPCVSVWVGVPASALACWATGDPWLATAWLVAAGGLYLWGGRGDALV